MFCGFDLGFGVFVFFLVVRGLEGFEYMGVLEVLLVVFG